MKELNKHYCLFFIGLPGSGKSTAINFLLETNKIKVLSTDNYIESFAKANNKTYEQVYHEYIDIADKEMKKDKVEWVGNKESFIWDQMNIIKSSRISKIKHLKQNKYKVIGVCFNMDIQIIKERVNKRYKETGKLISDKLLEGFIKEYELPSYDEGFDSLYAINDKGKVILEEINKEIGLTVKKQ